MPSPPPPPKKKKKKKKKWKFEKENKFNPVFVCVSQARPKGGGGGGGAMGATAPPPPLLEVKRFFVFCFCFFVLLVIEVGGWKIDLKFLRRKKKVSESPPPPPPPPAHQLFQDLRDFRGWRRTCKKICTPLFKKLLTGLCKLINLYMYVEVKQSQSLIKHKSATYEQRSWLLINKTLCETPHCRTFMKIWMIDQRKHSSKCNPVFLTSKLIKKCMWRFIDRSMKWKYIST